MSAPEGLLSRLRHVARIIGPSSASARALAEYDQRTAAGENVTIFDHGDTLVVGPLHQHGAANGEKHGG